MISPKFLHIPLAIAVVSTALASLELVKNGNFSQRAEDSSLVAWSVWQPQWQPAACRVEPTAGGLKIDSDNWFAVGAVTQTISEIEASRAYRIQARCRIASLDSPGRSLLVRVGWTRDGRLLHPAGMLVRGPVVKGEIARFDDVLTVPKSADGAVLSLEAKWIGDGSVVWNHVSMTAAEKPKPRKVRVGTVYLRPRNSTPQKNLDLFCDQIDAGGKLKLDILCLGETILSVGTRSPLAEKAEPIPGPSTEKLGAAAARNDLYVVVTLNERVGRRLYNTAVLIDRTGAVAGKYRKVHLPREEWKKGVTPGDSYPVFETDFGTIAMQICYDWFFPEPEAIFALKGAEIIFAPTWGNTWPDADGCVNGETIFRVRARDNGVYMVPSVYDGNSMVIDPMGRILASSRGRSGVFWAEIDLNKREPLDWVGHWRSIAPRHRMPQTYKPLTNPDL